LRSLYRAAPRREIAPLSAFRLSAFTLPGFILSAFTLPGFSLPASVFRLELHAKSRRWGEISKMAEREAPTLALTY